MGKNGENDSPEEKIKRFFFFTVETVCYIHRYLLTKSSPDVLEVPPIKHGQNWTSAVIPHLNAFRLHEWQPIHLVGQAINLGVISDTSVWLISITTPSPQHGKPSEIFLKSVQSSPFLLLPPLVSASISSHPQTAAVAFLTEFFLVFRSTVLFATSSFETPQLKTFERLFS